MATQEIADWSQWVLSTSQKMHDIPRVSFLPQSPWEQYESNEHEIVAIRLVSTADHRTVWECQRTAIPLGEQIPHPLPQLRHYPDMSHAWAVQRYDALTTAPWHIVDLAPHAMVHQWVAARELTKTDPPRWVFYQPDPPMTTWTAARDVSYALTQRSGPEALPAEVLADNDPTHQTIVRAWQAHHTAPAHTRLTHPPLPVSNPRGPRM